MIYGILLRILGYSKTTIYPDSKIHGANMGPILGRQDPGGPHVGPMNLDIRDCTMLRNNEEWYTICVVSDIYPLTHQLNIFFFIGGNKPQADRMCARNHDII